MKNKIDNIIRLGQTGLSIAKLLNAFIHDLEAARNTSNGFYFDFNEEDNNFVL